MWANDIIFSTLAEIHKYRPKSTRPACFPIKIRPRREAHQITPNVNPGNQAK
jgi:hypothetical protein